MPRDNAKANRAIAEAWKREQELVCQGLGTRDWTPEQQRDILETGKAHDEMGKAFEGHHMQSVSKYPEYQDNPENIQFLSRSEHANAHGGSYQNPTNGFYDYVTGDTINFGDEKYRPCLIITLTDSVVELVPVSPTPTDNNPKPNNDRDRASEKTNAPPSQSIQPKHTPDRPRVTSPSPSINNQPRPNKTFWGRIKAGITDRIEAIRVWWDDNGDHVKDVVKRLGTEALHIAEEIVIEKMESMADDYADMQRRNRSHDADEDLSPSPEGEESTSHAPDTSYRDDPDDSRAGGMKSPHLRRGHMSHYWTGPKDGDRVLEERWIDDINVNSGKQDEDTDGEN